MPLFHTNALTAVWSGFPGFAGGLGGPCGSGGPSWQKGLSYSWKQTYKLWHHFVVFAIFSWSLLNFWAILQVIWAKTGETVSKIRGKVKGGNLFRFNWKVWMLKSFDWKLWAFKDSVEKYEVLKIQLKSISVRMLRDWYRKTKTYNSDHKLLPRPPFKCFYDCINLDDYQLS